MERKEKLGYLKKGMETTGIMLYFGKQKAYYCCTVLYNELPQFSRHLSIENVLRLSCLCLHAKRMYKASLSFLFYFSIFLNIYSVADISVHIQISLSLLVTESFASVRKIKC